MLTSICDDHDFSLSFQLWFVIFDLQGGATNDIAQNATAYAHRDALVIFFFIL